MQCNVKVNLSIPETGRCRRKLTPDKFKEGKESSHFRITTCEGQFLRVKDQQMTWCMIKKNKEAKDLICTNVGIAKGATSNKKGCSYKNMNTIMGLPLPCCFKAIGVLT